MRSQGWTGGQFTLVLNVSGLACLPVAAMVTNAHVGAPTGVVRELVEEGDEEGVHTAPLRCRLMSLSAPIDLLLRELLLASARPPTP